MTPTSIPTNSGLCVSMVPALAGTCCCRARDPARPRANISGANLPSSITMPPTVLYQVVFVPRPANAELLLLAIEVNAYMISVRPCGPGFKIRDVPILGPRDGPDLLAEVFRRPADHQPGDEHGDDREHQQAVHACADTAGSDLAEGHVEQRDAAAKRSERVVERGHRAG